MPALNGPHGSWGLQGLRCFLWIPTADPDPNPPALQEPLRALIPFQRFFCSSYFGVNPEPLQCCPQLARGHLEPQQEMDLVGSRRKKQDEGEQGDTVQSHIPKTAPRPPAPFWTGLWPWLGRCEGTAAQNFLLNRFLVRWRLERAQPRLAWAARSRRLSLEKPPQAPGWECPPTTRLWGGTDPGGAQRGTARARSGNHTELRLGIGTAWRWEGVLVAVRDPMEKRWIRQLWMDAG